MRLRTKVVLGLVVLFELGYGQPSDSLSRGNNLVADSTMVNRYDKVFDQGSWLGVRCGVQMNGGPIEDRWTLFGTYELRFGNPVSIPIELQYHRTEPDDLFLISAALKFRGRIFRNANVFAQGGIVTSAFGLPVYYAFGSEIGLSQDMLACLNIQKIVGLPYCISFGLVLRP